MKKVKSLVDGLTHLVSVEDESWVKTLCGVNVASEDARFTMKKSDCKACKEEENEDSR